MKFCLVKLFTGLSGWLNGIRNMEIFQPSFHDQRNGRRVCYPLTGPSEKECHQAEFHFHGVIKKILLYQDLTGAEFSKWLCYAHGFMTIAGFVLLFVYAAGR